MKQFIFLISAFFGLISANATNIIFAVDMTGQNVSSNGVHIMGTFQNPQWNPASTLAVNYPGTPIYYYVLKTSVSGRLDYKYVNGNTSNLQENVPTDAQAPGGNRWFVVDTTKANDTVLVSWQGLSSSALAIIGYNKQYVRLRVNMAKTTSIHPEGVLLTGLFNDWGDSTQMLNLVTSGKVYEAQLWLSSGTYPYKFKNGSSGYETVPNPCAPTGGNRSLTVGSNAVVMTPVCFNECSNCIIYNPKFDITFRTDISEIVSCNKIDSVDILGNHLKLGNNTIGQKMNQVGISNIYSIQLLDFDSNTTINYKYRLWKNGIVYAEILTTPSRTLVISRDSVLNAFGFARNSSPLLPPAKSPVTFMVDFGGTNITPGTTVSLKAFGLNGWLGGASNNTKVMTLVPNTGGKVYSLYQDTICDGVLYYSFLNDASDERLDTLSNKSCLMNASASNFVRAYNRPAGASTIYVKFGSCAAGNTSVGISSNGRNESFRMYPNPMHGSGSIEVGNGYHTINIIDITGKVVRSYNEVTGSIKFNKDDLSSGIYIVEVTGSDSHSIQKLSIN